LAGSLADLPPPAGATITRKAFRAFKGAIITGKAYRPPSRGAGYPPSITIRYSYLLLLTLLKTRKNKKKKGKKREKKGSNKCNRCLKSFAKKNPQKKLFFLPPRSVTFITICYFLRAAPIVCSS
jgi:hypothetical protein